VSALLIVVGLLIGLILYAVLTPKPANEFCYPLRTPVSQPSETS